MSPLHIRKALHELGGRAAVVERCSPPGNLENLGDLDFAVVVAVILAWMVQVAVDQIIDVIAVRDRFVAAPGAMSMAFVVFAAVVFGSAFGGIGAAHFELVLFDAGADDVMQMPIVQIVDVAVVPNRRVPAIRSVLMSVALVLGAHTPSPWC
jgi:hypothetical protein